MIILPPWMMLLVTTSSVYQLTVLLSTVKLADVSGRELARIVQPLRVKNLALVLVLLMTLQASAQTRYRLSFPNAQNHYVEVEATLPAGTTEVFMPVWTPGSYMVREYSRQVEDLKTQVNGKTVELQKTRKNRWSVPAGATTLTYRVYSREMTVRTNFVDSSFALICGANTFIAPVGHAGTYEVTVALPAGWGSIQTGLPPAPDGAPGHYLAVDFDQLLDCPILAGSPAVYAINVANVKHHLVNEGEGGVWDGTRSATDVTRIVAAAHKLWGEFPYAKFPPNQYWFLNILSQAGGGLEHRNSTVFMSSRWAQRVRKDYLGWLGLVAHEYFHTWNVKQLRPDVLGPFDYENEVYTRSLWVVEGITSYYDDLLVARAGLSTPKEYLEAFSKNIETLQGTPGRKVQSLSLSSFDAWIKLYRPDENSPNTAMSYYTKGAVVAWLLDAEIRSASGNKKSLDDLMRAAYQKFSGAKGYTEAEFRALANQIAGKNLDAFFAKNVDSTAELDYGPALKYFGLRFKPVEAKKEGGEPDPGWLGMVTANQSGRLVVTQVKRETPAFAAGLNAEDEILAINDYRVMPDKLDDRLKQYPPGTKLELLVARREKLLKLAVTTGKKPGDSWALEVDPEASDEAKARFTGLLKG